MTTLSSQFSPLCYQPNYEVPEEEEAQSRENLATSLRGISETTFNNSGHATRSVHAKSHGLLIGELHVLDNLPPYLAQGIFAKASSYPVVMRISTIPAVLLDDNVSTARGFAVKVVGVEGERLMGTENAVTQDFVLVNGPVFLTSAPRQFLSKLKLLAARSNKVPALKKVLSTILQGTEKLIEAVGGESATLKAIGWHAETNVLGEIYFSQVPIMYGDYMAKISIAPISNSLIQLKNTPVDLTDKPDGLRQAVAHITAKPQQAWSVARSKAIDDEMSFNHGTALKRTGQLDRLCGCAKCACEISAKFRAEHNKISMAEPANLQNFPI